MKVDLLKANQAKLKESYRLQPKAAVQRLEASAEIDWGNLACEVIQPKFLSPVGLHPSSGGDGTFACSVEIMLASLVTCAGVTMAAVADSMKISINKGIVAASAIMDFRGTLAVDRAAPVGITAIELSFDLASDAPADKISKLVELTERYCVVYQSFRQMPSIEVKLNHD